jgi:uncharacterized membrane protein YjjB (DUF3815 family)
VNSLVRLFFWDLPWAGLAALGFAMLFSVPKRGLVTCTIIGATTHALRAVLVDSHLLGLEAATVVVSIGAGFAAILAARGHRILPTTVFSSVGLIPMVPGTLAYHAVINGVRFVTTGDPKSEFLVTALRPGLQVALLLGGMGVGLAVPLMFARSSIVASLASRKRA